MKIRVHNIDEVPSDIAKSNIKYNENNYSNDEYNLNPVSDNIKHHFTRIFDKFDRVSDVGKDIFYDIRNAYYKNKNAKNYDDSNEIVINKKD